jgi:ABC transporter substrate binding protein (PQQ-dependent alcohol dehydrogenase system)
LATWLLLGLLCAGKLASAATWTVAVLGMESDPRYQARRLEHSYPGHPSGRALDAARLAAEESDMEVAAAGHKLLVKPFLAADLADLPKVLAQVRAAKAQYLLLDLPLSAMQAVLAAGPAAVGSAILFNVGSSADSLRAAACAANLLHTYPSQAMLSDALAQYLASRSWNQTLVLFGPAPQDQTDLAALQRAAKRYGLKLLANAPFKLSSDPRERDLSNVRLLTNDKRYDTVAVVDSDGEFARSLPYAIQWPRPVVGANGLVALAWHPQWELHGGPQLSRRFVHAAHRPMDGQDWAAWAAVKSVVAVLTEFPQAALAEQLRLLRSGQVFIDGFKGPRLSFRSWDGQLRQPVFLAHADGVVALAPLDGVIHPTEVMDTLGVDEKESQCKARP